MASRNTRNGSIEVTVTALDGSVETVTLERDSFLEGMALEYPEMRGAGTLVFLTQEGKAPSLIPHDDFPGVQLQSGDAIQLMAKSTKVGS